MNIFPCFRSFYSKLEVDFGHERPIFLTTYKKATRKDLCTRLPQWAGLVRSDSIICNIIGGIDSCPRINCLRCTYTVGVGGHCCLEEEDELMCTLFTQVACPAASSGSAWQLGDECRSTEYLPTEPAVAWQIELPHILPVLVLVPHPDKWWAINWRLLPRQKGLEAMGHYIPRKVWKFNKYLNYFWF